MTVYQHAYSAAGKAGFAAVFEDAHGRDTGKAGLPIDVSRVFAAVLEVFARWYRFRRSVAELRRLDGRMLRDLGLERDQIEQVARNMSKRNFDGQTRV